RTAAARCASSTPAASSTWTSSASPVPSRRGCAARPSSARPVRCSTAPSTPALPPHPATSDPERTMTETVQPETAQPDTAAARPFKVRPLLHDIAHLSHVELFTPVPEESLAFFVDVLGMTENGREGDSVYLRTWDDYEHHSLKLTAASTSGVGRTGLRASSQEALERRVAAVEAA